MRTDDFPADRQAQARAFPRLARQPVEFLEHPLAFRRRDARAVVDGWPTPVVFSGYEIGAAIFTGTALTATGQDNPVRRAYELYRVTGGHALTRGRPSWDQTAVLAGVRDPGLYWDVVSGGRCVVTADGSNTWESDPQGTHAYLAVKTPPEELARLIDGLMVEAPSQPPL